MIYRTVGSGGSFGASPLQQHIGLGKDARILNIEVTWPVSGTRQTFSDVGKNQFLEIHEFAKDYARLERKRFRLGGPGNVVEKKASPAKNVKRGRYSLTREARSDGCWRWLCWRYLLRDSTPSSVMQPAA